MSSNPDYWQKIQLLFRRLRENNVAEVSDQLVWVNDGLFAGAAKEMRQSSAIAHTVIFTILVDLISEIEDDDNRESAWKNEFIAKIRKCLTTEKAGAQITRGLGSTIAYVKKPHDLEIIWTDVCEYFIGMMSPPLPEGDSGVNFQVLSQRWVDLMVSILRNLGTQDSPTTSLFLKISARPLEVGISIFLKSNGSWIDGMLFLASLVEDPLLWDTLFQSTEMETALQAFQGLVLPEHVNLLHSLSSKPMIRYINTYCNSGIAGARKVWEMLINEAIPTDRPIELQNPDSLIYQVVSVVKPSKRIASADSPTPPLTAPRGVNMNLVKEMTTALRSYEIIESEEANRLVELLISLCSLYGIRCSGSALIV
jgi:hypothetical protein